MPRDRPVATPDTKYGSRPLQLLPKSEGLDVWELQIKLIGWGSGTDNDSIGNLMDPVRVTGKFDSTTRDALMRFQNAHKLPLTGVADDATFRAIDLEAALHPVMVWDMRCPCVRRTDDPDPDKNCRCEKHTSKGKCTTGFGKSLFKDKTILEGKTLAGSAPTDISGQGVDLHDAREYDGVDKALLWAVRALMHRAQIDRLAVVSGYRCWHDNYLHTDERRWRHRRLTLHFGKSIEFMHADRCADPGNGIEYREVENGEWTSVGWDYKDKPECGRCSAIRAIALAKCGFQSRWQLADRISVAEGMKTAQPPSAPFTVHLSSVRRLGRQDDDFVKTHFDGVQPLYDRKLGFSMPLDLGAGIDPAVAASETYFRNTEDTMAGTYPLGAGRVWHTGVHLYASAGKEVYSLASGEVVACRVGESETAKAYGSRNFVLLRHEWKTKKWYSLYMHLDAGKPVADSPIGWRKALYLRSKDHVDLLVASPLFVLKELDEKKVDPTATVKKKRLVAAPGLGAGDSVEADGAELDPLTLDDQAPKNSKVVKVAGQTDTYVYTQLETKAVGKLVAKDTSVAAHFDGSAVISLSTPIPVGAGVKLGTVGALPTDPTLGKAGTFVHVEAFAGETLDLGPGWQTVEATDASKAADRAAATAAVVAKGLLAQAPDKVMLQEDALATGKNPNSWAWRSVILKAPNAWSVDWKAAIAAAPSLTFLKTPDQLGDAFNEYRWWSGASAGGALPGSEVVYHYHPIALLIQFVNTP